MLEFERCVFSQGAFDLRVDWTLSPGARLAVIGPSGAGKSTLLAGLAGFVPLTQGSLNWNGLALGDRPDARPIAMLFQDHNLFPHLSIGQNVGLGIQPSLKLSKTNHGQVRQALEDVGLAGFEGRKPSELSGGQQSRAALARVLVMARPIILLDEPFSALGPAQRVDMLALVKDVAVKLNATLIMVTHEPKEAEALDGHVSFVENGVAAAPVRAEAFFANPPAGLLDYIGEWAPRR